MPRIARLRNGGCWLRLGLASLLCTAAFLTTTALSEPSLLTTNRYAFCQDHDPDGIGKCYMGREIAQVMGHQGADWLERSEREREEKPDEALKALKIKPGDAVADIG